MTTVPSNLSTHARAPRSRAFFCAALATLVLCTAALHAQPPAAPAAAAPTASPPAPERAWAVPSVESPAADAERLAHRRAVETGWRSNCPGTTKAFEVFVDLNALRIAHPDWFATSPTPGPGAVALNTLELANARAVTIHGWSVPPAAVASIDPTTQAATAPPPPGAAGKGGYPASGPALLVVEITASARSDPPGTVATRRLLTLAGWPTERMEPAELALAGTPGPVGIVRADNGGPGTRVLGAGYGAWVRMAHLLYAGSLTGPAQRDADLAFRKWQISSGMPMRALLQAARPWLLLAPVAAGSEPGGPAGSPAPLRLRVIVPLQAKAPPADKLLADLAAALPAGGVKAVAAAGEGKPGGWALAAPWGPIAALEWRGLRAPGAAADAQSTAVEAIVTIDANFAGGASAAPGTPPVKPAR